VKGVAVGAVVLVGWPVGAAVGVVEGVREGKVLGEKVGSIVGSNVGTGVSVLPQKCSSHLVDGRLVVVGVAFSVGALECPKMGVMSFFMCSSGAYEPGAYVEEVGLLVVARPAWTSTAEIM
jgi:hypothetical protein